MTYSLSRRQLATRSILVPLAALAVPDIGRAQDATPEVDDGGNWPLDGRDLLGSKATARAGVNAASVGGLAPLWEAEVGGPVSATSVIAGEVVYIGSYNGQLLALDRWSGTSL